MAVKIKLKRLGKVHRPVYRIVVADSRTKRDGRAIEEVGTYDPLPNPSVIDVNSERVQYWLGVGAKPTESVQRILALTGDWQKFTGEGDAAGALEVAPARASQDEVFAKAVSEAAEQADAPAPVAENPVEAAAEAAEEVSTEALEVVDAAAAEEAAEVEATADSDAKD
ncbi:MAG: 30S ribosomal protein S16 [Actinobacteria bacterium]|nr:30S ribosomal protein S16 [Actinomycetota bacterium]MCB9412877.1 30S ribosomal protein S16 [Actinomycetota bacterium]